MYTRLHDSVSKASMEMHGQMRREWPLSQFMTSDNYDDEGSSGEQEDEHHAEGVEG